VQSVRIALAVALALAAVAVGAALSRAPLSIAGTSSATTQVDVEFDKGDMRECQRVATIPQGTSAIRVALEVRAVGPTVTVEVLSRGRLLTRGELAAGWGVATSATVPVKALSATVHDALVCTAVGPLVESFRARGALVNPTITEARGLSQLELGMEFLRPGPRSWWSLVPAIVHNMGLGRAPGGTSDTVLAGVLLLAVALLAVWLTLRELAPGALGRGALEPGTPPAARRFRRARKRLRRMPRAAWICALIACANAACWSLLTPPFQVPDEPAHFAYTQHLVEDRDLPTSDESTYSPEERAVLVELHHAEVRGSPETHTISTAAQQQLLQQALALHLSRRGAGVGGAVHDPPLYYVFEAIPYGLASAGTLLDQLQLMRLFSSVMAGLTALLAFLFVRETLPRVRWAWTVGGLGVALAPLLGFMSGGVNPDSMLFAVSAAIFYCLARAFRRGLTRRLAVTIGLLVVVGLLTNLNFVGLTAGVALGLVVMSVRASRTLGRRSALVSLALALALAAFPVCAYVLANLLRSRPALGLVSEALGSQGGPASPFGRLSYIWQLYLPRLPGMANDFPGLFTTRLWFDRSVGLYGWLDTTFPASVDELALIPAALLALLCLRGLGAQPALLRGRVAELCVYAVMGVGLLVQIGSGSYRSMAGEGLSFVEPRYLAPLLPLLATALVLAARGAGRRWGPAAGAAIVVLFLAHDVFSQLLLLGRYYA
jgi:hypothetical protein